jgi:3-methyladenine DNA glycosylase AlkD
MVQKDSAFKILKRLKSMADPKAVAGMARFGIPSRNALGISLPVLRKLAGEIGPNHPLAEELWESRLLEARVVASLVAVPEKVTERQMERWAADFDSWAITDCCALNLYDKTPYACRKAMQWSRREEEFVKRAGFALMAALAVHDKGASDGRFLRFLPAIKRQSNDERNLVKKAVNWALRQIGKRNLQLNRAAVKTAREIQRINSRSARWIAADALRELTGKAVQKRLRS